MKITDSLIFDGITYKIGQIVEMQSPKKSKKSPDIYEILALGYLGGDLDFPYFEAASEFPNIKFIGNIPDIAKILSNPLPIPDLISDSIPEPIIDDSSFTIGDRVICANKHICVAFGKIGTIVDEIYDKKKKCTRQHILFDDGSLELHHYKGSNVYSRYIDIDPPDISIHPPASRGGKRSGAGRPPTGRSPRATINIDLEIAQRLPNLSELDTMISRLRSLYLNQKGIEYSLDDFFNYYDSLSPLIKAKKS